MNGALQRLKTRHFIDMVVAPSISPFITSICYNILRKLVKHITAKSTQIYHNSDTVDDFDTKAALFVLSGFNVLKKTVHIS